MNMPLIYNAGKQMVMINIHKEKCTDIVQLCSIMNLGLACRATGCDYELM